MDDSSKGSHEAGAWARVYTAFRLQLLSSSCESGDVSRLRTRAYGRALCPRDESTCTESGRPPDNGLI